MRVCRVSVCLFVFVVLASSSSRAEDEAGTTEDVSEVTTVQDEPMEGQDDLPTTATPISDKIEKRREKLQRQLNERMQKLKIKTSPPPAEQDKKIKSKGKAQDQQERAKREKAARGEEQNKRIQEKLDLLRELESENAVTDYSLEAKDLADDIADWNGGLVCPEVREVSLLARACRSDADCRSVGEQCCKDRTSRRRCVQGVAPPIPEIHHEPFLGLIPRVCPGTADPLVEPWAITNCTSDADCWPRVCCRDGPGPGAYCRTPQPEWERLPAQRIVAPLRLLMSYLQCTPPPPPVFDLFPKPCRNTLDCFPNLCCQERGRKVCRPPKRSLLALLAAFGQSAVFRAVQQQSPPNTRS